jgi:hypothetical protein
MEDEGRDFSLTVLFLPTLIFFRLLSPSFLVLTSQIVSFSVGVLLLVSFYLSLSVSFCRQSSVCFLDLDSLSLS